MSLTAEQRSAVHAPIDQHLTIEAGPGTGKTHTLVERVRYLLRAGIPPKQIVCVAFTQVAAHELGDRMSDLDTGVLCTTLHAWAYHLLEQLPTLAGRLIYTAEDAEDVAKTIGGSIGEPMRRSLYRQRLRTAHATDYDLLLTDLQEHLDALRAKTLLPWHVLVDEAQDLDEQQHRLLDLLRDRSVIVTTVGDRRQSIYRWREARPDLWTTHGTVVSLTASRRCPQLLLDHAQQHAARWPEMTSATAGEGGTLHLAGDVSHPSELLTSFVEQTSGIRAVLTRTWAQAAAAERVLGEHGRWYGTQRSVWSSSQGLWLARWILLALRPSDDNLAQLVLNGVAPGLGDTLRGTCRPGALLSQAVAAGHVPHVPHGVTQTADVVKPLVHLGRVAAVFLEVVRTRPSLQTLRAFHVWRAFGQGGRPVYDADREKVHVMTVHAAKGLEFDAVLAVYSDRTSWPTTAETEDEAGIRYVACTRARRHLWIAHPVT